MQFSISDFTVQNTNSFQITQAWNTPANETMEHFKRAVEGSKALKGDRVGVYQNVYLEIDGKGMFSAEMVQSSAEQ